MYIEQKGRTLHLLKARSKPVPQVRKRRKIDLLGTFQQFSQQEEEYKQEETPAEVMMSQTEQVHQLTGAMNMGIQNQFTNQPNIIGNAEDKNQPVKTFDDVVLSDDSNDLNNSQVMMITEGGEKDITPMAMRSKRKASKARY